MSRASAYAAATMTVTVTEALTLNSKDYCSTQSFTINSIANVNRRIVTVTTTEAVSMTMAAAPATASFVMTSTISASNYIAITGSDLQTSIKFQVASGS